MSNPSIDIEKMSTEERLRLIEACGKASAEGPRPYR
jgi:hypothetical protein